MAHVELGKPVAQARAAQQLGQRLAASCLR